MLEDRRREPVGPQERPDVLPLAFQGVAGGRVVKESYAKRAVGDLAERPAQCLDVLGGLPLDLPQQRLAEVREVCSAEPTDEPLGARDSNLVTTDLADRRSPLEHLNARLLQHRV